MFMRALQKRYGGRADHDEVSHRPRNIGLISIKEIIRAADSSSLVESAASN
jgi:hypothetical protein